MTPSDVVSPVSSRLAEVELTLFRVYSLRICYLILTFGLGLYMWPSAMLTCLENLIHS